MEDHLGRSTPRGCVTEFLKAAGHDDYAHAARYLDTGATPAEAQELARQLKVVLDLGLSGSVEKLPRTAEGDLQGELPPTRQRVGLIKTKTGTFDVVLDRVQRGTEPPIWLFSAATLQDVPRAFRELQPEDFTTHVPTPLSQIRFLSLPLWRWFAIFLEILISLVFAFFLTRALIHLLRPLVRRITGEHDDRLLASLRIPVGVIIFAVTTRIFGLLGVSLLARQIWREVAVMLGIIGTAWLVIRFSDILSVLRARQLLLRQASDKMALLAFTRRLFKTFVVLIAIILLLRGAGVNVTAMLAGLGIGGIAVALAAQKTLENFFGGIGIIMREVVRVGDFCKIADQTGTIEDVGFASTRVRTLDRTVVSVSNAQVAQTSIENYTMRDKFWLHHIFGLRYDTSAEQMRHILTEISKMLSTHPKLESDSARIRFVEFGRSSLDVEVFAYVLESDYVLFLNAQEDVLLRVMDIITASGTGLAVPVQLNYNADQLVGLAEPPSSNDRQYHARA